MDFIGFHFKKINIEKFDSSKENFKLNTNILIESITNLKNIQLKSKKEILKISFNYSINYSPKLAEINLAGDVLFSGELKESKEILKEWKNKKISDNFRFILFNVILRKSNIKALQLEEEVGLPPHIQLPFFKKQDNGKSQ